MEYKLELMVVPVSDVDRAKAFYERAGFILESEHGSPRISQAGAALLLRLFEQGAFNLFECRPVEGGVELLTQYSKGLATLIEPRFWGSARRQQPRAPTKRVERTRDRAQEVALARQPAELVGTIHRLI